MGVVREGSRGGSRHRGDWRGPRKVFYRKPCFGKRRLLEVILSPSYRNVAMRFVVYLVAVLAAAGIAYVYSGVDKPQGVELAELPQTSQAQSSENPNDVSVELISLKVPGMHCPFACYPSVKKTLEGQSGVELVELSPQKEEGVIDNPVVLIKVSEGFDVDSAIQSLAQSGFEDSAVVQ